MQTGPRTTTGKAIAAQNAYKHGVYSKQLRLREDEQEPFHYFQAQLLRELQPDGALQAEIFTRLLRTLWTLRRLDRREDDIYCETGLPLAAANPKEFENTLRYRRFLAKEQRDLTAELQRLQTEAALRHLGDDYSALAVFSPLVAVRPLVDLHNARCASANHGRPRIVFGRFPKEKEPEPEGPGSRVLLPEAA